MLDATSGGNPLPVEAAFRRGAGCDACRNTGFRGRLGILELLEVTPAIKSAILRKAPTTEITTLAVKEGMLTMVAQGMRRAANGETTIDEVLRVVGE